MEYLLSAGALDNADTTVPEVLPPHSLLQKCQHVGGSWQWVLGSPDLVSSGSEGVGGQAEFGMSSGKMWRSGVQFLQVSPWVWGTARTPQGIRNAVRYLWLLSKGIYKDLLPGTWPSVSFFS